jgi:DNA-binding MarR family transcriptional regulator
VSDTRGLTVLYDVWTLSNVTERVLAAALSPLDLSPGDFALYSLLRVQGPLTPTELARASGSPAQSLTYALRRAETRGHVAKHRSESDRRSYTVSLTPAGVEMHERAEAAAEHTMAAVESELAGGVAPVRAALSGLRAALDRVDPALIRPSPH